MNKCARCGQIFRSIFPVGYCGHCQALNERQSRIEYDERAAVGLMELAAWAMSEREARLKWHVKGRGQ